MGSEKRLKEIFRRIGISKEMTARGIMEQRRQEQKSKKRHAAILFDGKEITDDTDLDELEKEIDRKLQAEKSYSTKNQHKEERKK